MIHWRVLVVLAVVLSGCQERALDVGSLKFKKGQFVRSSKSSQLARSIESRVQKEYMEYLREVDPINPPTAAQVFVDIPRKYLDLKVYLYEQERRGVLSNNVEFDLPQGGAVIDLKRYVTQKNGNFRMMARFESSLTEEQTKTAKEKLRVYFVSNSRRRVIHGRAYGSGCGRYYDLTKYFNARVSRRGVLLNTSKGRYVSVLAGTFYLFLMHKEALYLGAFGFEDSRFKELHCVGPQTSRRVGG